MFEKMINKMFRRVDGVVFDITTGTIGIEKDGSVFTLGSDGLLAENMFAEMSAPIPAFAKAIKLSEVKLGDLVINQIGEPFGFVTKLNEKSLGVLKTNGTISTVSPAKVNLLGEGQTIMVVQNLGAGGIDPMMLMLMGDGEGSDEMFIMLSMMQSGNSGNVSGMNNMLPMLLLSKNKDTSKGSGSGGDMFQKMMMMQMMTQGTSTDGSMNMMNNPMLMALMLGK